MVWLVLGSKEKKGGKTLKVDVYLLVDTPRKVDVYLLLCFCFFQVSFWFGKNACKLALFFLWEKEKWNFQ